MDTPDKAAAFSDRNLADAVNKDWLILSTQSSRHPDANIQTDFNWYTTSWAIYDGSPQPENTYRRRGSAANESSWLLSSHGRRRSQASSINKCLLYDNISFADSFINQSSIGDSAKGSNCDGIFSASTKEKEFKSKLLGTGDEEKSSHGRFRIFLAFYLLLGITLAIYSRNALSLAAVGMLASNAINTELETFLQKNSITVSNRRVEKPFDGSCPIDHERFPNRTEINSNLSDNFNSSLNGRKQIEEAFKASVMRKIEAGELVDWTPSEQGLVFASGSLGNLLIAIPLTRFGEIYGPKWIIFTALIGAALQAAFMPLVAPSHLILVILFQIIFNGLTYGADCVAYTLFAHWLTPTEMAFCVASLLICYQLGTITSSFFTAQILTFGLHWSWCFYVPAILCGLWSLVWIFIGASEPSKSLFISKQELAFLEKHSKISHVANIQATETMPTKSSNQSVSWLKLFKDPNIWAIISVKFTLRWYFSVYASLMPTYLSSVAHLSVKTIGLVSILQSSICLLSGILMSYFTRTIVNKRPFNLSLAAFRKIFQSIVNFGLAINLLLFIAFDCNSTITIVSLTLSQICINFYVAAGLQLPLDLSSNHCGLITSISNTLALGQVLGAPISGLILNGGPRDRSHWKIVWLLAILLNTTSGLLFIYLVDSKPRDYDKQIKDSDSKLIDQPRLKERQEY